MELKCRINGQDFENISAGEAFSDEFNETLDSGTIVISHQEFLADLKPFDDVYIWDADYDFIGFDKEKLFMKKGETSYTFIYNHQNWEFENQNNSNERVFYKHLLVENFSETMINLRDIKNKNTGIGSCKPIYEYKIQLQSETKGLEVVQLPNVSVTEPLNQLYKKTIWEYLEQYIELYSPTYKKVKNASELTWEFEKKYSLSPSLEVLLNNVYSPDFTLNNPNLKDVIANLLLAKDLIPYVKNNVIYGMDITKRGDPFEITEHINYVSNSMTSIDYCDNLKKTYSEALSKNNSARSIEYIGFRNDNEALMTLENMKLETRFPIYKINKIYMCYFKKVKILNSAGGQSSKIFLCKQDITPLVKLNTERNVLEQDWDKLEAENPLAPEDMAKYKMCTVGYDIGSKQITGWGTQYTYPNTGTFWNITKTYIQNIFEKLDLYRPYGVYSVGFAKKMIGSNSNYSFDTIDMFNNIAGNFYKSKTLKLKSFIFEIDYQAFYSGTVIHTKDNGRDNITINDNPSSSLTLLEQDGLFTKEKANRFGNKAVTINARYDDISQMQPLGSVFHDYETGDDDIIIYHREYQIWDNYVQVTYFGVHDYVLKNYYTNVYARHRTWNLIPYNESVRRSENKKMMVLLSKNKLYYEDFNDSDILNQKFLIKNITTGDNFQNLLFSCFNSTTLPETQNLIVKDKKLNYAYIKYIPVNPITKQEEAPKYYLSDLNGFVSGNSLCLNIAMGDNISGGNQIVRFSPNFNDKTNAELSDTISDIFNYFLQRKVKDDYTGSLQSWEKVTDDYGFAPKMGFYLGHKKNNFDYTVFDTDDQVTNFYNNTLFKFPYIDSAAVNGLTNVIGNDFKISKDNKEIIDMTYQIEPISLENDVCFSPWMMQLNDLITPYNKFSTEKPYSESQKLEGTFQTYFGTYYEYVSGTNHFEEGAKRRPFFIIKISKTLFNAMAAASEETGSHLNVTDLVVHYGMNHKLAAKDYPQCITSYQLTINGIKCTLNENGTAKINLKIHEGGYIQPAINRTINQDRNLDINNTTTFTLATKMSDKNFQDTTNYFYFMFSEYKMKDASGNSLNYLAFVPQLDWDTTTTTGSNYEINSQYSASSSMANFLGEKCVAYPASFYSANYSVDFCKYYQNSFVITSNKLMNKEIVYDKYGFANDYDGVYSSYKINDIVKYDNKIWVCKKNINKPMGTFDNTYWTQVINAKVNGKFYKITDDSNFWSDRILNIENKKVDDVFKTSFDERNFPYLKIDLTSFTSKPESVQYWYEHEGTINFVFGTNVTDDEWTAREVKIYISNLSTRDTRVYDNNNMLVGNILNYAEKNLPEYIQLGQYYGELSKVPTYKLTYNNIPGVVFHAWRGGSKYGPEDAPTGNLESGETLYWGDSLTLYADVSGLNAGTSIQSILVNGKDYLKYITADGMQINNIKNDINIEIIPKQYAWEEVALDQSIMPLRFSDFPAGIDDLVWQFASLQFDVSSELVKKIRFSITFTYNEDGVEKTLNFTDKEIDMSDSADHNICVYGNYGCTLDISLTANGFGYNFGGKAHTNCYGTGVTVHKFEEYR